MQGGAVPVFGVREPDQVYIDRPGAYALVFNKIGQIATVRTHRGFFLPGGASEPGETQEETVRREILEETGLEVSGVIPFRSALEYFLTPTTKRYYQIYSTFFTTRILRQTNQQSEADHQLVFLSPTEAARVLYRESQAWAVQEWRKGKEL